LEPHDHNSIYTRKEACMEKHLNLDRRVKDNEKDIRNINVKINATLVFACATLIGVVLLFLRV